MEGGRLWRLGPGHRANRPAGAEAGPVPPVGPVSNRTESTVRRGGTQSWQRSAEAAEGCMHERRSRRSTPQRAAGASPRSPAAPPVRADSVLREDSPQSFTGFHGVGIEAAGQSPPVSPKSSDHQTGCSADRSGRCHRAAGGRPPLPGGPARRAGRRANEQRLPRHDTGPPSSVAEDRPAGCGQPPPGVFVVLLDRKINRV